MKLLKWFGGDASRQRAAECSAKLSEGRAEVYPIVDLARVPQGALREAGLDVFGRDDDGTLYEWAVATEENA